jgi:hypothetical protein
MKLLKSPILNFVTTLYTILCFSITTSFYALLPGQVIQTESIETIKQQLDACQQKKVDLLQRCDKNNCLKNIHNLQSQLESLEHQEEITPLKKKIGTIICRISSNKMDDKHKAFCSALESLDSNMHQFRTKNHKQTSSIERRIAELTQQLLNSMPLETRQELKRLLAEYNLLQTKMHQLDPSLTFYTRQPTVLELLFI